MGDMGEQSRALPADGRDGQDAPQAAGLPRGHRRPSWALAAGLVVGYSIGGMLAHLLKPWLPDLTLGATVVAEVGGLAFILRYWRTDWRAYPWGRHVMTFMVCLEILFTLTLSRRIFGIWPGLIEIGFLAYITFAAIVWWRFVLQVRGERAQRDD